MDEGLKSIYELTVVRFGNLRIRSLFPDITFWYHYASFISTHSLKFAIKT